MKRTHLSIVGILLVCALTAAFWSQPAQPAGAASASRASQEATPPPAAAADEQTGAPFPLLAVLVLAGPALAAAWFKSRPGSSQKIKSVSCLPVIDGDVRPFRPGGEPYPGAAPKSPEPERSEPHA